MEKIDFQKKLDNMLQNIVKNRGFEEPFPSLLLHSCCAPCSSYVLEYLSRYFRITIYYYNPNISDEAEYKKRVKEQQRLISELPVENEVSFIEGDYDPSEFYTTIKGLELLGERSERCYKCYHLRLMHAAKLARELGFDYFTTTLSISPYKNAVWLNEIGEALEKEFDVKYLYADFKKKNGYKRSIELSEQYHLYRQDFCGCSFSKAEEELRKQQNKAEN